MNEAQTGHIQSCSGTYHLKNDNSFGLSSIVRMLLRSHRHDIAGRVQALWGSVELLDSPSPDLPEEIIVAIHILEDLVNAWRGELLVLDQLLDGSLEITCITSSQIREALPSDTILPETYWYCDLEGLYASIRHAYKTVGRTGYRHLQMNVEAENHLVIEIIAGEAGVSALDCENELSTKQSVAEVFAGDIDAAFAEAHAYYGGFSISGYYTNSGAGIRLVICPA